MFISILRRYWLTLLGGIYALWFFACLAVRGDVQHTMPTQPDPAQGQVIPVKLDHNRVYYLSEREKGKLERIGAAGSNFEVLGVGGVLALLVTAQLTGYKHGGKRA